ncbi:hypothetical protein A2U01_0081314, partial [Trifolium medium]|nr:hypothetical protein [Trifolium medium]
MNEEVRTMKVTMEELEEGIAELELKKAEPCPQINVTDLEGEDLW